MRKAESIVGNSASLSAALDHLSSLAPVHRPILIIGERGTGKELAAERLHYLSPRWEAPYIKVNCAAMADTLLESELFGHEVGAFTGASQARRGRFERADGGTLFLDELATMSPRLQEKLLRLVEYGEFERLGGQKTLQVDVRVVAATNADLQQLAARGEFRHDLLDRLSFDVVHLPPLRARPEDISELANHFAIQMSAELGWELFPGFEPAALAALQAYAWPGNVRELKNAVERSVHRWGNPLAPIGEVILDPFLSPFADREAAGNEEHPRVDPETAETAAAPASMGSARPGLRARVDSLERELLETALQAHGYNQRATADALDLTYDQLRGLVRKHGLRSRRTRKKQ